MTSSEGIQKVESEPVEALYEPAELLAQIVAAAGVEATGERPTHLPLGSITVMPILFQPRGMSEKHIGDLVRAIERFGEVDPVMMLEAGKDAILIDGHHRVEAYKRAGKTSAVPVIFFEGTPQEAVLEAGVANSKAKLPMTTQERQNHAWRLVLLGAHSKSEIARASGISLAQVANMRSAKKKLEGGATDYASWFKARSAAKGEAEDMSEDDREQWKQDMADRFADRLTKEFSTTLANRPEIAAMALADYFGRRLPDLFLELRAFVSEDAANLSDDF